MCVKSPVMAWGLANAWSLGSAKFANAPPLGLTRCGAVAGGGGGLGTVELTDALSVTSINAIDLVMVLEAKHDE